MCIVPSILKLFLANTLYCCYRAVERKCKGIPYDGMPVMKNNLQKHMAHLPRSLLMKYYLEKSLLTE